MRLAARLTSALISPISNRLVTRRNLLLTTPMETLMILKALGLPCRDLVTM